MENRHPEANCQECPLFEPANAFVPTKPPRGLEVPRLAVVGEAPGFNEAAHGEPFVGPSGKLLDQVLNHYDYKRDEVMYTNVCLCRPPNNQTPPKAAINACRPRLYHEIRRSGVRDIIALGGTASSVLVDDPRTISGLRVGPPKSATQAVQSGSEPGVRVIPTWHPAYCLRTADAFPALVSDIGKLKESDREPWSPPDWRYYDDPVTAKQVIRELASRTAEVVIDIEAGIEKDISFGHPNEYDLLCVGLAYARGKAVVLGETALKSQGVVDELRKFLAGTRIIAHNGKFDLEGLYPHLGGLKLWFDTMIASYCVDERPGNHGLKTLAVEKLGAPQYDLEIKKYVPRGGSYANIPRPLLYKYCAYDVACTWDLKEYFAEVLEDTPREEWPYPDMPFKSLRDLHNFLVGASNELMFLELNGIKIDRDYSNELRDMYLERLEGIEKQLDDVTGHEINPRSPKQIKEYLESKNVQVSSTNVDTLERLLRTSARSVVGEFVSTLLKHRREQKLFSTYVKGIRKRMYRGRVYTTYLLHGTTSGRLSSRNPNLQNIVRDKDIRKQFTVSKPGNLLVHADYKQAEGRVITWLAQDEYLRSIFSDPTRDLFDELSDSLYGPGNWRKEVERVRTKAFFYGLSYGRQAYSIALEYGIPVAESERRLREFMQLIPDVDRWQRSVKELILSGKDLITPFGRRRRFWLITEQNKSDVLNEGLSYLPQSIASDICLSALIRLRPMLRGLGWIRLTVHDALVVESPERNVEKVSEMLHDVMVDEGRKFTDYIPFGVDLSVGTNWGSI